jgi:uncharacterized protein
MKKVLFIALLAFASLSHASSQGQVAWFDIRVTDFHRAEIFYTRLFKWTYKEIFPGYSMILNNGTGIGGIETATKAANPGFSVLIYFSVDDLKRSYALALASGASPELKPTDIPGFGSYAIIRDPDGNRIALHSRNK